MEFIKDYSIEQKRKEMKQDYNEKLNDARGVVEVVRGNIAKGFMVNIKNVCLYLKGNGKPLKDFHQGSQAINFALKMIFLFSILERKKYLKHVEHQKENQLGGNTAA